jgi:hypothetical protein
VGAASTKSRRFGTAGWAGRGEQDGKVYARNRRLTPLEDVTSSNPADAGWVAVRTCPPWRAGNSRPGLRSLGWEAVVNVYGVATAMPQGYSRVPNPLTG